MAKRQEIHKILLDRAHYLGAGTLQFLQESSTKNQGSVAMAKLNYP